MQDRQLITRSALLTTSFVANSFSVVSTLEPESTSKEQSHLEWVAYLQNNLEIQRRRFHEDITITSPRRKSLVCGFSLAQSTTATPGLPAQQSRAGQPDPSNSRKATETLRIAPGGVIPAQLTKSLDAKKVKTGDEIEAKVTQDLKSENGAVIVPKDTKVLGHVTEAQARSKDQKESEVDIAFDRAIMKNGTDLTLPMSVQAIVAPPSLNAGNSEAGESMGMPPSAPGGGGMSPSNRGWWPLHRNGCRDAASAQSFSRGGVADQHPKRNKCASAHHWKHPRSDRTFEPASVEGSECGGGFDR